jgi:hypothetical protein
MRTWLLGAAVLACQACSLVTPLGGLASLEPEADVDVARDGGGSLDAGTDSGGDGTTDAVNLHSSAGSFELGSCAGWGGYLSTRTASSIAHAGASSCEVCGNGGDATFSIDDLGFLPSPPIGARYVVEAWIRSSPGKVAPSSSILLLRAIDTAPAFAERDKTVENAGAPTATWTKISAALTVTQNAQHLNAALAAPYAPGACFLIDDVAVYRTQ